MWHFFVDVACRRTTEVRRLRGAASRCSNAREAASAPRSPPAALGFGFEVVAKGRMDARRNPVIQADTEPVF